MMEKRWCLKSIVLLVLLTSMTPLVLAHGDEPAGPFSVNPYLILFTPLVLILLSAYITHHAEQTTHQEHENLKKVLFTAIILVTVVFALFILGSTIYVNVTSWTKGPVHWHADLSIELCGKHYTLPTAEGLSNRVGSSLLHTHEDDRIHIEGVIMDRHKATLGEFLEGINIPFSSTRIAHLRNGDLCENGKPGTVHFYVNGKERTEYEDYIIAPYATVPPGDIIKITFETGEEHGHR